MLLLAPRGWYSKRDVSLQGSRLGVRSEELTGSKCRASLGLRILKLLHLCVVSLKTVFSGRIVSPLCWSPSK